MWHVMAMPSAFRLKAVDIGLVLASMLTISWHMSMSEARNLAKVLYKFTLLFTTKQARME